MRWGLGGGAVLHLFSMLGSSVILWGFDARKSLGGGVVFDEEWVVRGWLFLGMGLLACWRKRLVGAGFFSPKICLRWRGVMHLLLHWRLVGVYLQLYEVLHFLFSF